MESQTNRETLQSLAGLIARRGLRSPALILLDSLSPLDIVASQLAIFVRPLFGGTSLASYTTALSHATSWRELHRLLADQDY